MFQGTTVYQNLTFKCKQFLKIPRIFHIILKILAVHDQLWLKFQDLKTAYIFIFDYLLVGLFLETLKSCKHKRWSTLKFKSYKKVLNSTMCILKRSSCICVNNFWKYLVYRCSVRIPPQRILQKFTNITFSANLVYFKNNPLYRFQGTNVYQNLTV